ncbi:MAG: T9SS type A sorting domain-containing protein [Bacteroidetes bacterium]|nr:T9SS type A sorting domain-containing protein [Bacteroidota bacterium]
MGKLLLQDPLYFVKNAFTCGFGMLLDSNGVIIWSRSFEKESNNEFLDVINTSDGGFLFSGSTFDIFSGQNGWAVKTDSMGVLTWSNAFDSPSLDIFYKATENTNLQNYAFAGETTVDALSNSDALLVVCDYTGAYLIGGSAGGAENDRATGIHSGPFSNFIMTGQTDIDTLFQTYAQGLSLEVDISTGNINNAVTIGDRVSNTVIKSSAVDNQGMILLGGFGNQFSGNKNQTFAIQKNSVPNTVCFEDGFNQLTTTLGYTDNFLADTASIVFSYMSLGLNIIPITPIDSIVCGTTSLNENTNQSVVTLYPNPSSGKFQLSGLNGNNVLINVYDNMGRMVCSKSNITSDTIINITNQSTGIYLIQITGTNFNQTIRFTLIND